MVDIGCWLKKCLSHPAANFEGERSDIAWFDEIWW
jgi:aminoglycoside phosphotransferase